MSTYVYSLILTLVTEIIVAIIFGFRTKLFIAVIVLINLITHPLLNFIIQFLHTLQINVDIYHIIPLEVAVIIAEWLLLLYVFGEPRKKLFLLSVTMNTVSFLAGIIVFWRWLF